MSNDKLIPGMQEDPERRYTPYGKVAWLDTQPIMRALWLRALDGIEA